MAECSTLELLHWVTPMVYPAYPCVSKTGLFPLEHTSIFKEEFLLP
jgi:hypothetical protein